MNLTQTLDLMLDGKGVSPERFAYLAGQLLSRGSVAREESQAQIKLYDEAFRVREVLEEYFSCVGLRLWHSQRLECFRLYPPTAGEGEEAAEYAAGLRQRLPQAFSAYALVLRHLYQQRLDVGDVDEKGELSLTRIEIEQGLSDLLDLAAPATTARKEAYRLLAGQRLVRLGEGVEEDAEDLLFVVKPHILDYVTETQLIAARALLASRRPVATTAAVTEEAR